MAWEVIIEEWRGTLTRDVIADAVHLAREAFNAYNPELTARRIIPQGA